MSETQSVYHNYSGDIDQAPIQEGLIHGPKIPKYLEVHPSEQIDNELQKENAIHARSALMPTSGTGQLSKVHEEALSAKITIDAWGHRDPAELHPQTVERLKVARESIARSTALYMATEYGKVTPATRARAEVDRRR